MRWMRAAHTALGYLLKKQSWRNRCKTNDGRGSFSALHHQFSCHSGKCRDMGISRQVVVGLSELSRWSMELLGFLLRQERTLYSCEKSIQYRSLAWKSTGNWCVSLVWREIQEAFAVSWDSNAASHWLSEYAAIDDPLTRPLVCLPALTLSNS